MKEKDCSMLDQHESPGVTFLLRSKLLELWRGVGMYKRTDACFERMAFPYKMKTPCILRYVHLPKAN